jgi:hypothetical protein
VKFTITPDRYLRITTIAATLLILGSAFFSLLLFIKDGSAISFVIAILLVIIYVITYLYHPKNYFVGKDELVITRAAGKIVIPKKTIQEVSVIDRDLLSGSMRTFGVGGLFGNFGKFTNSTFGVMTWYVRRMDQLILITTDSERILVSPDDMDGFIAALR